MRKKMEEDREIEEFDKESDNRILPKTQAPAPKEDDIAKLKRLIKELLHQ